MNHTPLENHFDTLDNQSDDLIIVLYDELFLKQVEQNLTEIITFQKLRLRLKISQGIFRYVWLPRKWLKKYWPLITKILLAFSIIAVIILLYKIFFASFEWIYSILFTIYMTIIFSIWFSNKSYKSEDPNGLANLIDKKSAESSTKKILKIASNAIPFEARYHFSDNLVNYHRLKDTASTVVFSKPLERFAIVHNNATLFYKSSAEASDQLLIVHDDQQ